MDLWFTFLQVKTLASLLPVHGNNKEDKLRQIDIKRGSQHDLSNDVGPYAALIRAALENKLHPIVGGQIAEAVASCDTTRFLVSQIAHPQSELGEAESMESMG